MGLPFGHLLRAHAAHAAQAAASSPDEVRMAKAKATPERIAEVLDVTLEEAQRLKDDRCGRMTGGGKMLNLRMPHFGHTSRGFMFHEGLKCIPYVLHLHGTGNVYLHCKWQVVPVSGYTIFRKPRAKSGPADTGVRGQAVSLCPTLRSDCSASPVRQQSQQLSDDVESRGFCQGGASAPAQNAH